MGSLRIGTRERVTRESLTLDLERCLKACIKKGDLANERLAIIDMVKLNGLVVEKKQVQGEEKVQWIMTDGVLSRSQWESQYGAPASARISISGNVPRKINGDDSAEK